MIQWEDCSKGINTDALPSELENGVWSDGRNVRFRSGFAERVKGIAQVFENTSVVPYYLLPYQTNSAKHWIHAGLASIYTDDGTTRTNLTGPSLTGTASNRWTGGVLSGVPFLNNQADVPMYWDGNTANNFATLPGWTSNHRCQALRAFGNKLIALNITKNTSIYPHMVKWSHVADPGSIPDSWDETDDAKDAGEQDLAETTDPIVDGAQMGDSFVIYKDRSMFLMRNTFDSRIFSFQRLPGEVGALSQECIADTPVGHVVLTAGDVIVHQGQGPRSIVDGKLRRFIFSQIDSTYAKRAFVCSHPAKSEVWICFPTAGNSTCNMAVLWNWREDKLGIRELPNLNHGAPGQLDYSTGMTWSTDTETWADDVTGWDENEFAPGEARLLVCKDSKIGLVESGGKDFGTEFTAYLERRGIWFDAFQRTKLVKGLYPRVSAASDTELSIRLGSAMTSDAAPNMQAARTFTVGTNQRIDSFANGRFHAIRLSSAGVQPWRLRGLGFDAKASGLY